MSHSTIKLSKATQKRLKEYGKMGDSFEDVLIRLLDDREEHEVESKEEKYV